MGSGTAGVESWILGRETLSRDRDEVDVKT